MRHFIKLPYIEKVSRNNYKNLLHSQINIYGVRINFYSKDPNFIRFVERKFSLFQHYKLNNKRHRLVNEKLEVILDTKGQIPGIRDLRFLNNDIDGLIAGALSSACVPFHASCVASGGKRFLFLGPCMSGKSTIAVCLKTRDFALLADDCSSLKYNSLRQIFFPTAWNMRSNPILSNKFIKIDKLNTDIYSATDSEFKEICDLSKWLYGKGFDDTKNKQTNFIFIKGRVNGKPRLEAADKVNPDTIKLFFKYLRIQEKTKNDKISDIMDLYSKINTWFLTMGRLEDTAELILKRFS